MEANFPPYSDVSEKFDRFRVKYSWMRLDDHSYHVIIKWFEQLEITSNIYEE